MTLRKKANKAGVAAKLDAGTFEVMEQLNAMHLACAEAAEAGAVEKTFRKCAWLAYEPGLERLRVAEGERWSGLPLGGTNLTKPYIEGRFLNLDDEGVPKRPDWNALHRLRLNQQEAARAKRDEQKKGKHVSVMASLSPESPIYKEEQENKKNMSDLKAFTEADTEKGISKGFMQEFLPQQDISEEDHEAIFLKLKDIAKLESMEESAWWRLPPKRRRELVEEARLFEATAQTPSALENEVADKVNI